jgi:quercetin 2,3-dioxygenase
MEREIIGKSAAVETAEGAGATVKRAFPNSLLQPQDPFVMLDEFFVRMPASFPAHPHRGFEIITYIVEGGFRHNDNLGNDRSISAGGLQRITTGSGIVHSEMPTAPGLNHGLQLWINLPQRLKGIAPEYQEVVASEIPEMAEDGVLIRTIAGGNSPVRLQTDVYYLDVTLDPGRARNLEVPSEYSGFLYIFRGRGRFGANDLEGGQGEVLILGDGADVSATSSDEGPLRFALISGRPHGEPMRLRGPYVD